jgi:hypothetical protein
MRKYIYSLIALFMVTLCSAQMFVNQAEYFWDTDPGAGNETAVLATDGTFNSAFEQLTKTGITTPGTGLHKFNIRIKDSTGQWGPVFTNIIDVQQTSTPNIMAIAQAEYFWDTDPGEGNGSPVLATDGNFNSSFEQITKSGIALPSNGLHVFNVRIKDNTGVWGPVFKNVIAVQAPLSVNPNALVDSYYFVPNPADSTIRFNKDIESIVIVDLNGRQFDVSVSNNQVIIEGLATGTYILKVTTPDGLTFNKRMIKR